MKLFDKKGNYTEEGKEISSRINEFVTPLVQELLDKGYSSVEVGYMLNINVNYIVSHEMCMRMMKEEF